MKKTFEAIQIGDELPHITKEETLETIRNYMLIPLGDEAGHGTEAYLRQHADEEYTQTTIFGGPVNAGAATVGYVCEMLEAFFPINNILSGGVLEVKATKVVRAGDTITTSGKVVNKEVKDGKRTVLCELYVKNQKDELVAAGTASVPF